MQSTPHLALPLLMPAQAQKHITHNEALLALDALVQLSVLSANLQEPPDEPTIGARYLVAPEAEGDWLGQSGKIALYDGQAWGFFTPQKGWRCFVESLGRDLIFTDDSWKDLDLQSPMFGINAQADSTNRLSLSAPASLFNHEGAGHQLKLNKASEADTASLLYQSGFSGRAEIGLMGEEHFSLKVSADGSDWLTALRATAETGKIFLPQGADISGAVTGTALVHSPIDSSAGLLLTTGWMGLGRTSGLAIEDIDDIAATGFYSREEDSADHAPSDATFAILHQQIDSETAVQIALGLTGEIYQRQRVTGVWTAWQRLLSQGAILGQVSQSAGLPTGAIFESGNNGNGRFSRFADGTLICLSPALSMQANAALGAIYASSDVTWTFPASFSGSAVLSVSAPSGWANARQQSNSAAQLTAFSASSMAAPADYHAMAIGRWF